MFKSKFGHSFSAFTTVLTDDDWGFVIKLNAFIEDSLNRLLIGHFKDERLTGIISTLPIGLRKSVGKLRFAFDLELLTKEDVHFIEFIAAMRNDFAHKVDYLNFNLGKYFEELNVDKLKLYKKSLKSMGMNFFHIQPPCETEKERERIFDLVIADTD